MGKMNCTVRGEDWRWPVADSGMPRIGPWIPDGELIDCLEVPVGERSWVGYGEDTAVYAGMVYIGWINTDTGNKAAYKVSGNTTDLCGCFGIDNTMFGLVYTDRLYFIDISGASPAVSAEYEIVYTGSYTLEWSKFRDVVDFSTNYAVFGSKLKHSGTEASYSQLHIYDKQAKSWDTIALALSGYYGCDPLAFSETAIAIQGLAYEFGQSNVYYYDLNTKTATEIPHTMVYSEGAYGFIYNGRIYVLSSSDKSGVVISLTGETSAYTGPIPDRGAAFCNSFGGVVACVDDGIRCFRLGWPPEVQIVEGSDYDYSSFPAQLYLPGIHRYITCYRGYTFEGTYIGRLLVYTDPPKPQTSCGLAIEHEQIAPEQNDVISCSSQQSFGLFSDDWLQTASSTIPLTFTELPS